MKITGRQRISKSIVNAVGPPQSTTLGVKFRL
jgi:hypothetical protein